MLKSDETILIKDYNVHQREIKKNDYCILFSIK